MKDIQKIFCAIDFSGHSAKVAEYTRMLALCMSAEVVVFYAAPTLEHYAGFDVPASKLNAVVGDIISGAEKSMDDFVEKHFAGLKVTPKVVSGYPADEILAMSAAEDCDLIVIGTHGRKGLDRLLFGSVAEKVVKSATRPVLTVRPEA